MNESIEQPDDDPVVAEIRQARETLLARFNYDLRALVKHLQQATEEDARAGLPVADPPPRRPANWPEPKKVG
jgi:hypothetical protein